MESAEEQALEAGITTISGLPPTDRYRGNLYSANSVQRTESGLSFTQLHCLNCQIYISFSGKYDWMIPLQYDNSNQHSIFYSGNAEMFGHDRQSFPEPRDAK